MLIIKLRSANTAETRQYKKATKALLVLIPLLGITYLVVLMVPQDDSVSSNLFTYLQAFLISTQVSRSQSIHPIILLSNEMSSNLSRDAHTLTICRASLCRCCIVSWIRKWNRRYIIDGKYGGRPEILVPTHKWNIESINTAFHRKSIHSVRVRKVYGK